MSKKSTDKDKFLKKPHIIKGKIGALPYEAHLAVAENLSKTTAAMANVAKAGARDDMQKRIGNDDYNLSLEKLMQKGEIFEPKSVKQVISPKSFEYKDIN